jgi:hypothetical protein
LWKSTEDRKYDCFETSETFIIENDVELAYVIITEISAHVNGLVKNADCYFLEIKNCQQNKCIANPFQGDMTTGISTKADEQLIDLSEDTSLKLNFNRRKLT